MSSSLTQGKKIYSMITSKKYGNLLVHSLRQLNPNKNILFYNGDDCKTVPYLDNGQRRKITQGHLK